MLKYILRRAAYSLLIMFGVMILTFVLFRVATGDPAATLLGKNPSPREVEDLRNELGSDKPLFWGSWKKTEMFTSSDFSQNRKLPGVILKGGATMAPDGFLRLKDGAVLFERNFKDGDAPVKVKVSFRGFIVIDGNNFNSKDWKTVDVTRAANCDEINIASDSKGSEIKCVGFYRELDSPYDSQLFASFKELVSFSSKFPYVNFFNFGRALVTREPINKILWGGIGPSLCLMFPIFFGELFLGIILALFSTAFKGSWPDKLIVLVSVAGMSVSYLVFIIFGQWFLGYRYDLFPVWGWGDLRHLFLPVIIGIATGLGGGVRFYRTVFINELNKEYLRTARAKGCSSFAIYSRHLLRNAMIPIITRAATILPFLFTGSLLLETFFGIPGLGFAGVNALNNSDLQMVKALVILGAFLFVSISLLTDIAYAWADPRVRLDR